MFGFGNTKETSAEEGAKWSSLNRTFGTTDIDSVLKEYMPELSNAILTASEKAKNIDRNLIQNGNNQVTINDNINVKHDEIIEQFAELKQQNLELQKKYDAVLERMDKLLAREEGKGR